MKHRARVAVPVLVLGALVAQAGLASPARAAGPRYASPTGTSSQNCLTAATACNIEKAINSATTNDEVIIASGTYTTGTSLSRNVAGLNIHGVAGQPRPVINSTAARAIDIQQSGTGTKISDLTILHYGAEYGLNVFAKSTTIQRVEVRTSGAVACSPGISGLIRDSLCVTTAVNGIALDDSFSADAGLMLIRNVTAIATGAGSYGIRADSSNSNTDIDIYARNVIASGVAADVRSTEVGSSSESDVILTNSNYDKVEEGGGGNVTDVGSNSTNQTAPPIFTDPVTFHQALGSPTIDKGTSDGSVGTADLDGDPRKFGAAVDIGVDEFIPDTTAPDTVFNHTPKRKTRKHKAIFTFTATEAATFTCLVDKRPALPCSSPFKAKFKKRGKHTVSIIARDAVGNTDATPATYTWKIRKKKHRRH